MYKAFGITVSLLIALIYLPLAKAACEQNYCSTELSGIVSSGSALNSRSLDGITVSIYSASETAPRLLAETISNSSGQFVVTLPKQPASETRYAVARKDSVELITILSAQDRSVIRINEMTTVATAYAMAQFIDGYSIIGKALPLQVAAGMFRNLVNPQDGGVSRVLNNPPNADQTNARRLIATLSNILAKCVRGQSDHGCATLFRLTGSNGQPITTTFEAMVSIAHNPDNNIQQIFDLGSDVQPYLPALTAELGPKSKDPLFQLDTFTVAVKVNATGRKDRNGAELCPFGGPGNLVFDPNGWAWITNNVVQGLPISASCFFVLKPDGTPSDGSNNTPHSPLFGGGVLGQGFGIARDPSGNIWSGNFGWGDLNPVGSVSKFSPRGRALSPSSGYVSTLDRVQGTTSDQSGNIWMASYYGNSVQVFPQGNPSTSFPAYSDHQNTKPFHIAIDNEGFAWVSYTESSTLAKFRFTNSRLEKIVSVPIGTDANPKGIGIDAEGNVWATAGKESRIYAFNRYGREIGGFDGGGITGPWGLSIDSKDNVWVANFGPPEQLKLKYRLSRLCGISEQHCPRGVRTGQPISPDTGYTLPSGGDEVLLASGKPLYYPRKIPSFKPFMRSTATAIDMAGNVWVTNNWKPSGLNDIGTNGNPGGDGMVIFVGLAAPVLPGIGPPRAP